MAARLTFGVEFEMAVVDGFMSGRQFHTDTRFIDFFAQRANNEDTPDTGSGQDSEARPVGGILQFEGPWVTVARHMAGTLRGAGFKASVDKEDNASWDFTYDLSIEDPAEDPDGLVSYTYSGIELRSPAMYFTPESVQAVADVLKLLKRTYCINTNRSTGLHVHVGDGKKGWPFHTLRKFFAFAWAFEPQLHTLHPASRIDSEYTKAMRTTSAYPKSFLENRGRRPTPMEGLAALMRCESFEDLYECFLPAPHGTFRMVPQAKSRSGMENKKPTIEWRHHGGTMDEDRVCMWIKTVVGTMDYLRNVKPTVFTELLSIVEHERWEKLGDEKDDQREREMGPILAEGEFTIIDLLQIMGLYEPARFYMDRGLYRIDKDPKRWMDQEDDE
jgi:Putative amidoligase enzyme